jgi:aspartokinase-like uncharacterized kinase
MARMKSRSVRVVKVGGSLFDFPDLVSSLHRFVRRQPPAANVLIAGGGPWADAVRKIDRCQDLDEGTAHRLCVSAMSLTARLLASLVGQWTLQTQWDDLRSWARQGDDRSDVQIFDVSAFLATEEPQLPGRTLPRDWSATSDSIAARVAHCLASGELVLLKSATLGGATSVDEAAEAEYVDRFFPRAVGGLQHVRCVNFRDAEFAETVWDRP